MKKLRLIFVWHMHQPYYKDDSSGEFTMPWVFLHAIKDYYELPWLVQKFPKIRAVFNLVPSLLIQLEEYTDTNVNDKLIQTIKQPITTLSNSDRFYLVQNLFHSNLKNMIAPLPRYLELSNKRSSFADTQEFTFALTEQELLDLEILFLLSWCGNAIRTNSEIVKKLLLQGSNYSEEDKNALLVELFGFVATIVDYYKELQNAGNIEIFTTPFYHPILPLLINKSSALEALPTVMMPNKMSSFSDDAPLHVKSAIEKYDELFGKKPQGFWPAEGSISMSALDMLSQHGVKYCAADEDVLFKSIGNTNRHNIYKPYKIAFESREFGIFFRDKELSDLIGFTYSTWDAEEAAEDFLNRLKLIYDECDFDPVVPIVLDGENAWEFYENNAYPFFSNLYELLSLSSWIKCVNANDLFSKEELKSCTKLDHIKAGSWIYGTFSTWIGQTQKNRAWELLSTTKDYVIQNSHKLSESEAATVQKELMIAEGSDWFWWYGDDHYTPLADQFDFLFRKHLVNIYDIFKELPPPIVLTPIVSQAKAQNISKPTGYVTPSIDGKVSSYFEWMGAGSADLGVEFSAMDSSGFRIKKISYGFDSKYIYFSLHGNFSQLKDQDFTLGMHILSNSKIQMKVPILRDLNDFTRHLANSEEVAFEAKVDELFEIRVAKAILDTGKLKSIEVFFEILKNDKPIERAPLYSTMNIEIDGDFGDEWYI